MQPGRVLLVRFPFTTLETTKKRPAVLLTQTSLGSGIDLCTLAMITSRTEGLRFKGDVLLQDWRQCHLLYPSLVRLSKIATLDGALVEKRLGSLSRRDVTEIKRVFRDLFHFWI